MVQMLTKLKPLGRPKQPRPTAKLHNTTVRDFGGGLNVVDSEQNLTSKFAPVFDNMVTYTDRKTGPRYGYEMWLKLKQGAVSEGTIVTATNVTLSTLTIAGFGRKVLINWPSHPFSSTQTLQHVTFTGFPLGPPEYNVGGITATMLNRTHGVIYNNASSFYIIVEGDATSAATSAAWNNITWTRDTHMLGGVPVECTYFANHIILWDSIGEIVIIDKDKQTRRVYSSAIAAAQGGSPIGWSHTEMVAFDIFGDQLVCSNGHDKPLEVTVEPDVEGTPRPSKVQRLLDPGATPPNNDHVPVFDACKSAFRYFTVHDTDVTTDTKPTEIRIAAKDTCTVFTDALASPPPGGSNDAVDIDMSTITASPEQAVRGFAVIKDALLVITPTATTLMKLGVYTDGNLHDPFPVDTLNGFGSNAPRTIVEIGSDVFMLDFNGVPSAKLSTVSNSVVPERVSNYIETMISKHIGRLRKETMRLKAFGFYDAKNKHVHFYLPKFDTTDDRWLTVDPFYFDTDMAEDDFLKNTLIVRHDAHQLEQGDIVDVSGATGFASILASSINSPPERKVVGVLNENYILISIGQDLPLGIDASGGGSNVHLKGKNDGTIGYLYHYVPAQKLFAWSRFKTDNFLNFSCGCGTVEGRAFVFTPDGFMMRYGSADAPVYGDWRGMYDYPAWEPTPVTYAEAERVYDSVDGLVYICLRSTTSSAANFRAAREEDPDAWEEYRGDPIKFAWELPWADFGNRQLTKGLRFFHCDANGQGEFNVDLFADNMYKNAANGQFMPARTFSFVPTDVGAYGAGPQLYGGGHRTKEQRLWQMPVRFKLVKARVSGATNKSLTISALSFMYHRGSMVRG